MNTTEKTTESKNLFKHLPIFDLDVKPYEVILTKIPSRETKISGKIAISKKDANDLQSNIEETVPHLVNKVGSEVTRFKRGDIVYVSSNEISGIKINTKDEFWKIAGFAHSESIISVITRGSELYNVWLNHFDTAVDKIIEVTKETIIAPNRLIETNDNNTGVFSKQKKIYATGK